MATALKLLLIASIFVTSATVTASIGDASTPTLPPQSASLFQEHMYPWSFLGTVLGNLGFNRLAAAVPSLTSPATASAWRGPITVFAPTDSSLLTCSSCSPIFILQEHTVPGLFPKQYLRTLAFGTKIETLAPARCLTITSTSTYASDINSTKIFIGGAEITRPDLYNDGLIVVHSIQGFISRLSPISCTSVNERVNSLSFLPPPPVPSFFIMRLMLKDAIHHLDTTGYSVLALALRVKYSQLLELRNMTVFALDDASIFSGGNAYLSDLRFHIVPNRLLMAADLESLPQGTVLPTMEEGQNLVMTSTATTAGGGGPEASVKINFVKISIPDAMHNLKMAFHGLSTPFPHIHPAAAAGLGQIGRSIRNAAASDLVFPATGIESTVNIGDHHGL